MDSNEGGDHIRSQVHYVSCMKINGVPLLPPLMTHEYKQEMQYYKKLALAVEKRISALKVCLDDSTLYSNNHPSDTEECFDGTNISYDPQDRSSFSERQSLQTEQDNSEAGKLDDFFDNNDFESMNSQVTIIDLSSDQNSRNQTESTDMSFVKMNASDDKVCDNNRVLRLTQPSNNNTPTQSEHIITSPDSESKMIEPKLTPAKNEEEKKDLEKVTTKHRPQKSPFLMRTPSKESTKVGLDNSSSRINTKKNLPYNSPVKTKKVTPHKKENISPTVNSRKIVTKTKDLSMYAPQKVQKKGNPILRHKLSPAKNITGSLNNISSGLISPPKLVRQNSYTLDSPSPLLLAHLEVQSITSGIDVGSISMSDSSKEMPISNISNENRNVSNVDSRLKGANEPKSNIETRQLSNVHNVSSTEHSDGKLVDEHWDDLNRFPSAQSSPAVKRQTNVVDLDLPIQNEFENKLVSNGIEMMSDMKPVQCKESPGVYFDVILRKFQEDHEKQMSALLKKQQEEQLLLRKTFENQQKLLMDQFQTTYANSVDSSRKSHSPQVKNLKADRYSSDSTSIGSSESQPHKDSPRLLKELSNDDSMEKYLTISADVLNASRSLLINRKTVNLSPTDIQCVNVVPTQDLTPSERNSGCRSNDSSLRTVYNRNDYSANGSFELILDTHSNTTSKLYLQRHKNDTTLDSNKSYEYYDRGDEPLESARTSNTLDDLNFTFSSDDGAHVNNYYNDGRSEYYSSVNQEYKRGNERDAVLAKARNKITEIQRNLSSHALGKRSERSRSDSGYNFDGDQTVSLSAIDVVSNNHFPKNFADRNHLSLNLSEINQPSGVNYNHMVKQKYKSSQEIERERRAATKIVSWCKGYLTRRLMKTERVESTVQTIRDALLCALQMHSDQDTIQGPDIDLHRRLIQQITAACYTLHDIFIESTAEERMRLIRQDRERKAAIMQRSFSAFSSSPHHRQLSATTQRVLRRKMDSMSRSHTGAFTSRSSRSSHYPANVMTRSHYEQSDHMRNFSGNKDSAGPRRTLSVTGDAGCRRPWR